MTFGNTAHLTPLLKMHTLGSTLRTGRHPYRRTAVRRYGSVGQLQLHREAGIGRAQGRV